MFTGCIILFYIVIRVLSEFRYEGLYVKLFSKSGPVYIQEK